MSQGSGASGGPKKGLTLDELIAAIDRHERNPSNIPKVETFHFCGERVSEWLERVEQALVGRSDVVKFQCILQYVLHSYHQEVKKVIDAAQSSWERFKEGMQRKYHLGDGLLTTADLEAMNKEDFTTIGAFVQEFKKRARKVEQRQVRLQRQKRKETDATASGTPGVTRIVTDVLAQLGYATKPVVQRRVVTAVQVKGKERVIEEVVQEELWEEEESVPQGLTKAQRKVRNLAQGGQGSGKAQAPQALTATLLNVAAPSSSTGPSQGGAPSYGQWSWSVINAIVLWGSPPPVAGPQTSMPPPIYPAAQAQPVAPPPSPAPSSQGSVAGGGNQGQGNQGNGGRGGGRGQSRNGGGRGRQWNGQGQGYQGQGNQGQGYQGQGYQGQGNQDKRSGLISSTMDGNIYDQFGEVIDRRLGGVRAEAQRRAAAGPPPPAMFRLWHEKKGPSVGIEEFRLWQEKEEPPIGVEEVGSDEEVTQGPQGGSKGEEPIIIEPDDENEEERMEPSSVLLGKMEDLLDKMGRYQQKLVGLCEEVRKWKSNIPKVFLYESGPESAPGRPRVNEVGSCPQWGIMGRPLTPQARLAQAARTKSQAKASASQEPPRRELEPGKRKDAVEVEDDDNEEEEDERLRREEDQRAEKRARKKGARGEVEPVMRDGPPKKKKYAVRLEKGFDVERVIDRLLEGHNDLMTLKEILASAPRLRDELKGRLLWRLVPNVHLGMILPKEAVWAKSGTKMDWKCVACGTVDLVVKGSKCATIVDTEAEMNIIREANAIRFGLDIDHSDCGILHGASCKAIFCGTASNVLIEVGKGAAQAGFPKAVQDEKCRPVPVLVTEDEEAYYERERGLIRRMRESALAGSCRINEGNEGRLIIGEPDFLLPQERTLMVELMKRRHRAYAFSDEERDRLDVDKIPMIHIHTVPLEPWNMRGARYPNPDKEKKVVDYLDGKICTHVADYSSGPYASHWFSFIKPNGTLRWVQDLQRLNVVTVRDAGGLPNADALSESYAGRPIISLIDLYSGYDQFSVYPPDRHVTAMHTPRGLIYMNVAPQGWTNAVAMVQRAMNRAMQSVSPHITQPYIDDLAVKGLAVKESDEVSPGVRRFVWKHIQDLEKVLSLLEKHNLTASRAKSRHCMRETTILGFVCSEKGRRPDLKKTDKITGWSVPFHSITDVRSFLGTCGFWRAFVKNFAAKTEHLRKLVRQDQEWVWGEEQEEVVARMKEEFRKGGLVLGAPHYDATETRPFIVETDAGPTALGGVLIQAGMEGKERPLRFENRTLCTTERNYSQFKRETLVVLHCLRIFRNYIFDRRWLTYIWMFNFELERIPGSKNRADGLSRINWDKQEGEAVENTPLFDGFVDQEEDVRLHINKWSPRVPSCVGYPIWQAPNGYERRAKLVPKPFEEEDPWGGKGVQWMMELALASSHSLVEDVRTIEEGPGQVERHENLMGGMYLLVNTLLQESLDQSGSLNPAGKVNEVPESQDDEFEEGGIKEAFRAEEYDGIYLELGLLVSDFTKTAMPRGGKGTRPPQRSLGASGGYERNGSRHRDSTPKYDGGNIELFLDSFWEHARRMGWTVTQGIERLRGVGRFEEPVARIRREATTRSEVELRMHELRPSPVGPDGRPIRLEIGNASDFIPAFEWFMQGKGIPRDDWMQTLPLWTRKAERPLARQVRSMVRDWESCRAHLREAFRRPEPPQPRIERHQRRQRQRDPEPREARPSRGGRKALARREEEPEPEPEAEERGAYPECGLGLVEFHRFTEGGFRRSPARTQEEPSASQGPLKELGTHLDISQWRASPRGEEHGEQAEEVPREEVPREEVQGTQRERGLGDEGRRAGKEVIEVGEDTPPQTPAVGLRLGDAPRNTRQAGERLQREEAPLPSSEKTPSPEGRAERRRERAVVRRETLTLIDRHLAAHALEHPDLEEPTPVEPRQESCQPEKEMEAEIPKRFDLCTRERALAGETAKEKRARRTRRIDEIWQKRQRLEAAGELPEQQQERQRSEAAGALPSQPLSAPARAPKIPEMRRDFWEQKGEELPSPRSGGKKTKEASHGVHLEAMEMEIQELRALVASQAAIIESLRQQTQGKVDKPESSRQGEQRQPGHGLPGQPSTAEPRQEPPMGRVILESEEARAQRQAEREVFEFRAPTELATLPVAVAGPVVPLAIEEGLPPSSSEPAQGSAEGSMGVLLEAVHTMKEEASLFSPEQRIEESLEGEMGIEAEGVIEGGLQRLGTREYEPEEIEQQPMVVPGETLERRPQRLDTPEYVPATGDLRSRLRSWAIGSGSGGPVHGIEQQQEVVSTAAPRSKQQGVVSTLVGSPSSPPPQPRKKKFKRKVDQLCF
ncbi:hypothetical protein CBR_g20412 [Chara braunii]|uniref:Reverse transcriptase domain-containing protein n=1 Tax=Chara braunii TaxID=69332 RepID=A0A388JUA7_CHABU|nr:hypothetical protein CBR_g20412 [Chara braunii]|eukprot:GBG61381.1 hypothetical protein CBR_g20412 [Chara braunii]